MLVEKDKNNATQTMQKQAAVNARHAEHRAIREAAIAFYDANKTSFRSIEHAARIIAKREPVQPRTIRDWISRHLKAN